MLKITLLVVIDKWGSYSVVIDGNNWQQAARKDQDLNSHSKKDLSRLFHIVDRREPIDRVEKLMKESQSIVKVVDKVDGCPNWSMLRKKMVAVETKFWSKSRWRWSQSRQIFGLSQDEDGCSQDKVFV